MKRMGHSSLHPAELAGQPFKRADGLGVGQDDIDRPPTGCVGGLSFGGGLGLHGSERLGLAAQGGGVVPQHGDVRGVGLLGLAALGLHLLGAAIGNEVKESGLGVVVAGFGFHGFLRVGPIPTMGPLKHVTTHAVKGQGYRSSGSRSVNHSSRVAA